MMIDNCNNYYYFGIDKKIMGNHKVLSNVDPIKETITKGGTVLIYMAKAAIKNGTFQQKYSDFISLCKDLPINEVSPYIQRMSDYTGGTVDVNDNFYSRMLDLMKKGVVIHHGSLPLHARLLIEQFINDGFCRICFATSTLEQGINLPFDIVYLDRFEKSKSLAVKNLIGRAGRSTSERKFDFGYVIVKSSGAMSKMRDLIHKKEELSTVSLLEITSKETADLEDFKASILDGTFSDEFNLTMNEISLITQKRAEEVILSILKMIAIKDKLLFDSQYTKNIIDNLCVIYELYLKRSIEKGEEAVLKAALKIWLWYMSGKTFKQICGLRYMKSSQKDKKIDDTQRSQLKANFIAEYHDIPDNTLKIAIPLFDSSYGVNDVDYDTIVCDTYDYIDKLIGFRLKDIYYAAFYKYYIKYKDNVALAFATLIKYGTIDKKHIFMIRYGIPIDEIDYYSRYINSIDENAIEFDSSISELSADKLQVIERFLP